MEMHLLNIYDIVMDIDENKYGNDYNTKHMDMVMNTSPVMDSNQHNFTK